MEGVQDVFGRVMAWWLKFCESWGWKPKAELGVEMETFAAPQFAVFEHCLSAFPDTDRWFGSAGQAPTAPMAANG